MKINLTISEAARIAEVSRTTIYKWIDSGRVTTIPIFKNIRRIPRQQIEDIRIGIR